MDSDQNFSSHTKAVTKSDYSHLKNISRIKGLMSLHFCPYIYLKQT